MKGLLVSGLQLKNFITKGVWIKCATADGKDLFKTGYGEPGVTGTWEFQGDWVFPAGLHIHCVHTCIVDACIVCTHACVMPGHRK